MTTPYFLISQKKLDENILSFQTSLKQIWSNSIIGYSVKTNSLPWLLSCLERKGLFAEVVSDEEYDLALKCGFSDNRIIFNGPVKGDSFFQRAVKNHAVINLDSKNDLALLEKYAPDDAADIGVRVNLPPEIFDVSDIGYSDDGFRFGFSDQSGELETAIQKIRHICGECGFGLHLHVNSVTRSVNVYSAIAEYAVYLIEKYKITPSFIDIGGGFFGGVPGKTTPREYITAVADVLKTNVDPNKTELILEPGSAIIGSAVDLHTSVIDVKDTGKSRIVTTDGSRIHIDPLWKKTGYLYSTDSLNEIHPKQIICGYTCMDHDRLMTIVNEPELKAGNKIIYHRVGAYSMTFGGMFIRYYPDVYVQDGDHISKIRSVCGVEDYINIHS